MLIFNLRLKRKLKTVYIAIAWLFKLGSITGKIKRIIKDLTEEINNFNEGGKKFKNKDIINKYNKYFIYKKYIKPILHICFY